MTHNTGKIKCLIPDDEWVEAEILSNLTTAFNNLRVIPIKVKFSLENIIENILLALENEENRQIINSSKVGFKVHFNYRMLWERYVISFDFDHAPCNLTWEGGYLSKWDKLKIIKICIKLLPELSRFRHLLKAKSYTELEKLAKV